MVWWYYYNLYDPLRLNKRIIPSKTVLLLLTNANVWLVGLVCVGSPALAADSIDYQIFDTNHDMGFSFYIAVTSE